MTSNERKVELLKLVRKDIIHNCKEAYNESNDADETLFINFEINRIIAELNYSINYYEVHK